MTNNTNHPAPTHPISTSKPKSQFENESAFLGALLLEGRPVRRLPKFHKLTPAHFSDPLHSALFALLRDNFQFAKTDKIQTRAAILKTQPAFAELSDHRAFLDNLMTCAGFSIQALDALLKAGPQTTIRPAPAPFAAEIQAGRSWPELSSNQISLPPPHDRQPETRSFQNTQPQPNQPMLPAPMNSQTPGAPKNSEFSVLNSTFMGPNRPHGPILENLGQLPTGNFQPNRPGRRKMRSDCVFAKLNPEQHLQLQRWLRENSYEKVLDLVSKDAPEGFGIHTHITSLHRYYYQTLHDDLVDSRLEIGAQFQDLAALCEADPIAYRIITTENLERRLMELSAGPQADLKAILPLMRLLLRHQEFEFKKRQFEVKHAAPKPQFEQAAPVAANVAQAANPVPAVQAANPGNTQKAPVANALSTLIQAISSFEGVPGSHELAGLHGISHSSTLLHDISSSQNAA